MANTINKPKSKQSKSKRKPVRLRHKIEKASAAKQRKQRKLSRKNPEWRTKLKKDPGIPNLFPYKEKLLQEIEDGRVRRKEEEQKKRELAKAAKTAAKVQTDAGDDADMAAADDEFSRFEDENRDNGDVMEEDISDMDESNPMAALLASARRAAAQYDRELQSEDEMDHDEDEDEDEDEAEAAQENVLVASGGASSRKAYDKVFKQVVEQADVVLYVLDARDPEGTRSRDVERAVLAASSGSKRLIFILNKVDLVPPSVLRGWLAHLRRSFPTLPLRASTPAPNAHTFHHRDLTVESTSAALFRALKAFSAARNLKRAISVGVIGYPNVGKSSVINALLSRLQDSRSQHKACPAGAEAGVTASIRAVKIDSKLTLLDSPGIIFPSTSSLSSNSSAPRFVPKNVIEAHAHLVLLNAVPPKQIGDPIPAVSLLLKRLSATPELIDKLAAVYDLVALLPSPDGGDVTTDFLAQVARKRGRLGRGGVPNIGAAAMSVVTDWRDGRIQGWTEPPVLALVGEGGIVAGKKGEGPMADQKEIVTEWAKEFKLEGLWGGDVEGDQEGQEVEMR